jgi:hypothetical protein
MDVPNATDHLWLYRGRGAAMAVVPHEGCGSVWLSKGRIWPVHPRV